MDSLEYDYYNYLQVKLNVYFIILIIEWWCGGGWLHL